MQFTKMQSLGNDFIVVQSDGQEPPAGDLVRHLAERNTGIGFDQLLWLEPPRSNGADAYYRIFNADGGEVEQCGNGARCIARLLADSSGLEHQSWILEHAGGRVQARIQEDGLVELEMGIPDFRPEQVPFEATSEQQSYLVESGSDTVELSVVSIGTPHAVIEVDDLSNAPVATLGAALESHARFPNRANIGFMQVVESRRIRLRVFERGAGETRACGTGACAAMVVGHRMGKLTDDVTVEMPGGSLRVRWHGSGAPVSLIGEAVTVFEGAVEV
jgi:diaminopimelate epimerase